MKTRPNFIDCFDPADLRASLDVKDAGGVGHRPKTGDMRSKAPRQPAPPPKLIPVVKD